MASYLVQAGTAIYHVSQSGALVPITLPQGIALFGSGQPCRFVVFNAGQQPIIVVVNGGTHDFFIDWTGVARKLQIAPPMTAPLPSAGSGSGLTGVYKVAASFKIKDANGATVIESTLSPVSVATSSLSNQSLRVDQIPVSIDVNVNSRGLYRTLSSGNNFYPWFDLDDNTTLSDDRAGADSALELIPTTAQFNSAPPDLKLCVQWLERLWGVPRNTPDSLRWTEANQFNAWSQTNELIAAPKNSDVGGITALIPRRADLGVAKRKRLYIVTGSSNDTFARNGISDSIGCVSHESVVVNRNVAYFLGERGVVQWDDEGVRYISDQQVRDWFQSDTFFNRSLFSQAQGRYNQDTDSYELSVALVGSNVLDHWISYQLNTRNWFGPHKTDAFTPSAFANGSELRGVLSDVNALPLCVMGGTDGNLYRRDNTLINDVNTAVAMSVQLPVLHGNEPDFKKYWAQPTIHSRRETQGVVTLTPTVGLLDETQTDPPLVHDLRLSRELLDRAGVGEFLQIVLAHSSTTERPRIYGIEFPYTYLRRR